MEWVRKILVDELDGMTRDEAADWIDDLESHGCVSGMVGCLVYYSDTRKVYEDNEDEILSFLEDAEFSDEPGIYDLGHIANRRVWAAFERSARGVFEVMADDMWPPVVVEVAEDTPDGPRVVYPAGTSTKAVEDALPWYWTLDDSGERQMFTLADGRTSAPLLWLGAE